MRDATRAKSSAASPGKALHRLLKEALVSSQDEELIGEARERERPQARVRAIAEDDGLDGSLFVGRGSSINRQPLLDLAQYGKRIDRRMGLHHFGLAFVQVMSKSPHVAMMRRVVPATYRRTVVTLPMEALFLDGQCIGHIPEALDKL